MKSRTTQSQPLRVEDGEETGLQTSRTIQARLWFVNNKDLEERIIGCAAKYQTVHEVDLYAFNLQGNHFHAVARFPRANRAAFFRDLNARTAEAVRFHVPAHGGGPLFERRYSHQGLPEAGDVEDYFFYCALQPVAAGLCERISDYPGYNSFHDAISGITREIKVFERAAYNARKRWDPAVKRSDFTTVYRLSYKRLPGYEHLSQKEYKALMLKKLEERRQAILHELTRNGHKRFLTREELRKFRPGARPWKTKRSRAFDRRPLVLSKCLDAKKQYLERYFSVCSHYKQMSQRYFKGELTVLFPHGTYRPPLYCHLHPQ